MTTASYPSAYDPNHFVGNTMGMKNLGDTSTMGGRRRRTRRHKKSSRKSMKRGMKSRKSRR